MKVFLIAAATLLAGATTAPALADPRTPEPSTVAAAAAAAPATEAAARAEKPTRYCVVDEITGSRIPVKVCKTAQQWSDEGVDVSQFAR